MITAVEPDEPYECKNGDVLWGAIAPWSHKRAHNPYRKAGYLLNRLNGAEFKDHQIIRLTAVDYHPVKALKALGIDPRFISEANHLDPYTRYCVHGLMPSALLTNDTEKYKDSLEQSRCVFIDLCLDSDFNKHMHKEGCFDLNVVGTHLLGTGYHSMCRIGDGYGSLKPAKVKLSNGDWLYVHFWEWHNK